jgi:hypothetical protein
MKYIINLGLGVNSTAILAMIKLGELKYDEVYCVFADVGAEKIETYDYLEFLKGVSPLPINIVKAKEKAGDLYEYCKKNDILPQRFLRWCTDRWKRKPLNKFRKDICGEDGDYKMVIGIAYDERHRAKRWMNDIHAEFPLIDLKIDRNGCIDRIKKVGWEVPVKSGCWFCPFAPLEEFANLKVNHREIYDELCEMERKCLVKCKKVKGWFNDKYPLDKLLARKKSWSCDGQQCLYCFDGAKEVSK